MQGTDYVAARQASPPTSHGPRGTGTIPDQKPRIRIGYWIGAGVAGALLWVGIVWFLIA